MPALHFDPAFGKRLKAFLDDPRIVDRVRVVSGSRSYAEQKYLYDGFRARRRGFNLAANPDRVMGTCFWADPPFVAKGSWHMEQDGPTSGGAGAADLGWVNIGVATMHSVAAEYGLRFPVPGEAWHVQAYTTAGIYPAELSPTPPEPERITVMYDAHRKTDQTWPSPHGSIIYRRTGRAGENNSRWFIEHPDGAVVDVDDGGSYGNAEKKDGVFKLEPIAGWDGDKPWRGFIHSTGEIEVQTGFS